MQGEGVGAILDVATEYLQPDSSDHMNQQVTKFLQYARTDHTMARYLLEFGKLRRKAEARVMVRSAFPDRFASILCVQNAALSQNEKSPLLASVQGSLAFPV